MHAPKVVFSNSNLSKLFTLAFSKTTFTLTSPLLGRLSVVVGVTSSLSLPTSPRSTEEVDQNRGNFVYCIGILSYFAALSALSGLLLATSLFFSSLKTVWHVVNISAVFRRLSRNEMVTTDSMVIFKLPLVARLLL